jgi:hypothetical protein
MCLDTSTLAKSIMDRREYYNNRESFVRLAKIKIEMDRVHLNPMDYPDVIPITIIA